MTEVCPTITALSAPEALTGIDCRLNALVEGGFSRLFGETGAFATVLTALLTVYVAFIAYGLLTGRTGVTMRSLAPQVLTLALVLTFATSWPAYQRMVFDLFTHGPDQILGAFSGKSSGGTQDFAARLQALLSQLDGIAESIDPLSGAANAPTAAPEAPASPATRVGGMIRSSAFILLLGAMGVLVVARILLAALLAVGPVFIALGLFGATRGLFEGWLRTALICALAPLLTVMTGSVGLMIIEPMALALAENPNAALEGMQPAGALLLAAIVDFCLMLAALVAAGLVTAGWRPAAPGRAGDSSSEHAAGGAVVANAPDAPAMEERIAVMVSAVARQDARPHMPVVVAPLGAAVAESLREIAVPLAAAPQQDTKRGRLLTRPNHIATKQSTMSSKVDPK